MKFRPSRAALLLVVFFASASMWVYWRHLDIGGYLPAVDAGNVPAKDLTDLYPRWYGARELLLHHRDPYGPKVSHEIQIAFYGKIVDPSIPGGPRDEQLFAYPLYVVFLLAPTVGMNFHTVRILSWWLLLAAAVSSALLWLRFLRLRLAPHSLAVVFLLLLSSVAVMQGVAILQLALLVSCFLSGAALAAARGRLFLSGTLLACATIKPQLALLPVVWFAVWTLGNWRSRRTLLLGFGATLAGLILASECLLPGWLVRYPAALRAYAGYTSVTSLIDVIFPPGFAWPLGIAVWFIALVYCWRVRRESADSIPVAIALGFSLTLEVLTVPTVVQPFSHVLLIPVALLMIPCWHDLWRATTLTRFCCMMFTAGAFLPWFFASLLAVVPALYHQPRIIWSAPLTASLALPFCAFGSLLLLARRYATTSPSPARDPAALKTGQQNI